jgi:hypothetical protein
VDRGGWARGVACCFSTLTPILRAHAHAHAAHVLGHYYTFVRHMGGARWLLCDDSDVSHSSYEVFPCARHRPSACPPPHHAHSSLRIASRSPCVSLPPSPSRVIVSLCQKAGEQPVLVFFKKKTTHTSVALEATCVGTQDMWHGVSVLLQVRLRGGCKQGWGCRVVAWQGTSSHGDALHTQPYIAGSVADMQEPDALPPLLHARRCGGKRRQCGCCSARQHPAGPASRGRSRQ